MSSRDTSARATVDTPSDISAVSRLLQHSRRGLDRVEAADLKGGVANLFLAGEWTDTGWPSTMEGAARSGFAAAAACCGGRGIEPDLPRGLLVRLCGRAFMRPSRNS